MTIAETRGAPVAGADMQQPPSLLHAAQALLRELPGLVSDRVKLLTLEMRRAGIALAQIVALAVASAILLITAWLAMWVGLAAALIAADMPWGWVFVLVLAINLGAAWLALKRARTLLALLGLPATVRRLTANASHEPPSMPSTHEHAPNTGPVA